MHVSDHQNAVNEVDQLAEGGAHTTRLSGLSGNEMYCAWLMGYTPGNLLVGNSVFSLGFIGSIGSRFKTVIGGEIKQYTSIIAEGRLLSLSRFKKELKSSNGDGATGVNSELIFHPGSVEFLTIGSTIHKEGDARTGYDFATSADAQELFCQIDAGYWPMDFVFGNVAYSLGVARNFTGGIRKLARGEVHSYSDVFNITRNLALERICREARERGANSVVGIRTSIVPAGTPGIYEMIMIGTASYNEQISEVAESVGGVTSSDLTAEETWNIFRGEISQLTNMIYGAREESLKKVQLQAAEIGADDVLGIRTYIYNLGGGLIEFLSIGTAVKKVAGVFTKSVQLPPQAIIRDKDTFINTVDTSYGVDLQNPKR
jgi:uncharacterized protein YbjQ (UPF0145 family)